MNNTEKLTYNFCAGVHNLGLVSDAKRLLRNFVDDGEGVVYIHNPDGSCFKLQPGFDIIGITGLGIEKEG